MKLTRRDFLKLCGGTTAGVALLGMLGPESFLEAAPIDIPLRKKIGEKTTICCYCGVGCGAIVASDENGKATNIEGDPDHPINQGALCSKGAALIQVTNNERRVDKVLYRAPYSSDWEEVSWDWAIDKIARNIKKTRDENWTYKDEKGRVVNHTEAIGWDGSAIVNNEEAYLFTKFARSLGITYLEHCARLCHSSTVAALGASFGRGAMTNHWIDIKNSNCIMIIGSNAAENHPLAFKWVIKAMEKGAKLISVDPRFTRTSSRADIYAKMRSGTDVAFIGGMIKYVIEDIEKHPQNYNMTYIEEYTNATLLIDPNFKGPADLDGLFSGYDAGKRAYDRSSWVYQLDDKGIPKRDLSLKDPNCVFQLLKKQFARYDVDTVCSITGTSKDVYLKVCEAYAATGKPDKSATIIYAMGTTQHTNAAQMIRSYSVLQLLLGNVGVAGGGINAARGQSNVQGSTDHCVLYHILPGYLKTPNPDDVDLKAYLEHYTPTTSDPLSANWWQNYDKYIISLLKAWYDDAAVASNDFAYEYLPKVDGDHSHIALAEAIENGVVRGLISPGHNTAVSGPNVSLERAGLDKLDWLVVCDLWETETAAHWKRPGVDPSQIGTEVFLLPAKASMEKEGSITNSGRWSQWRYKCCDGPDMARSDLWIVPELIKKLKELYAMEGGEYPAPILNLTCDYGDPPDVHKVAKEINGYDLETGELLPSFTKLKNDGTTSSGNWLYCASYTEDGNMAARRDPTQTSAQANIGLYPNWAWCWPVNRRIIYNRASVDLDGNPFNPDKPVINWHPLRGEWEGDVPDGGWPPMSQEGTRLPFIMTSEGRGHIFATGGALKDGPMPEHYEPWESPVDNLLSGTQNDPAVTIWKSLVKGDVSKYPIVATTYRLSEHWNAGQMTRNLPWLVELMPEMFVEVSEELAAEKGIKNGEKVIVESARGKIEAVAVVTKRFSTYSINGRKVHHIGMPWHLGYMGLAKGDSANMLTPNIGDANTTIPEYKAFLCDIRAK